MNPDLFTKMTADTRALVEQMQSQDSSPPEGDWIEAIRSEYRQIIPLAGEAEAVDSVEEYEIASDYGPISLRLYRPAPGRRPALVYFHGGGFVSGDLETHDRPLRAIANRSNCVVIAVDYRLAPEYPFPAAPEDCFAALEWVRKEAEQIQVDATQVAVGGDSAGGLLAAAVCLMCCDRKQPQPIAQILIYPNTDLNADTDSWRELDFLHPSQSRENFLKQVELYTPDPEQRTLAYASPLHASDLSQLAPALIITAELDAQRDEGEAYAHRLREAGGFVTHTRYPGVIHGFFQLGGAIASGKVAINEVAGFLRLHFSTQTEAEQKEPITISDT
ncbi:MAG: alpha/beta hydrolase [Cyanobacteria bacterium P01_A01_bin.17]